VLQDILADKKNIRKGQFHEKHHASKREVLGKLAKKSTRGEEQPMRQQGTLQSKNSGFR